MMDDKEGPKGIRHKTLSAYYPKLHKLVDLLIHSLATSNTSNTHAVGGYPSFRLVKDSDIKAYKDLLENTICAFRSIRDESTFIEKIQRLHHEHRRYKSKNENKNGTKENGVSQQEIINHILRDLSRLNEKNVLITGNRFPSVELPINISRPHIDNRHVNSPSSVLRGIEWKLFRSRIGDDAFRLLLTTTSLFLPVGNNCFIQLSGVPIYELYDHTKISLCGIASKTPSANDNKNYKQGMKDFDIVCIGDSTKNKNPIKNRKHKRKSTIDDAMDKDRKKIKISKKSTADVIIPRQRIYYGHASKKTNGKITYGLPHSHTLHKLSTNQSADIEYLKFAKQIFPSLFHNSHSDEIRVRGNPERLEGILGMIRELVARYRKIDFKDLLRRCTSRESNQLSQALLSTQLYKNDPDDCDSNLPITQAFPDTASEGSLRLSAKTPYTTETMPRSLDAVPHGQVCRYLSIVFRHLFSSHIIGSQHNLDTLLSHMRRFVKAKQYEPSNLHSVIQGIQINDFEWMIIDPNSTERVNITESQKRRTILENFVEWIFTGLLIPLLRNTFYITETSMTRYETVYYTHEDWQKATKPHLEVLKDDLLVELNKSETYFAQQGPLGVSAVRLIPKPKGFRPIVNLGKKIKSQNTLGIPITGYGKKELTANQVLKGLHQVLTFEKDRHKGSLGASLFGTNEIFSPLQGLKSDLIHKYGKIPRLYFVKMDIKAAFDTIKQDKMIEVVSNLLDKNHNYCIMLYCLLLPPASKASQGASRRLFKSRAVVDDHLAPSFGEHAQDIAEPLRNAVIVDLVRRKQITRESCLDLLKTHIQNNVWQVGKKLYKQKTGIPQGSKISSLLCSFFYACLENEHLSFVRQTGSRLLRYIDDFLFITDSPSLARRFVDIMSRGFPAYGAEISLGKTLLSFECETKGHMGAVVGINTDGEILFPYCGFLLNTRTLDVMGDYPRLISGLKQSFALRSDRHKGSAFVGWFSRQLENRNHVAYLDTIHNEVDTVHSNIFVNFALTSMKLPYYFQSYDLIDVRREQVIADALITSAEYTYLAGRARVKHSSRKDDSDDDHYGIKKVDFLFLAINAIAIVLKKKSRFAGIVHLLQTQLKDRRYRICNLLAQKERLGNVIEKGWEAVKDAQY